MKECLVLTRRDRLPPSEEKAECGGGQRVGDEETLGDSPGVRQGGLAGRRVHVRPLSTRLGCPGEGTTGAFLCQDPGLDPGEDPGEDPGLGPGVGPRADPGADPGAGPGAGQANQAWRHRPLLPLGGRLQLLRASSRCPASRLLSLGLHGRPSPPVLPRIRP